MDRLQRLTHEKRRLEITYTNKFAWTVLPDGSWEDKPCFIIGGGPSLAKFNWDLLKGKLTIAINRAYEKFEPTIIFGMDPSFVRWVLMGKYGDLARTKFLQSSAMKIWVNTTGIDLPEDIYILKCWRNYLAGRRAFPLTMKEGLGHGNNSGYSALNLAACLGANPIYLLGYDMKRDNDRTHWHDGHPKQMPDHVPDSFIKHFPAVAEILKVNEITVINLNPDSALDCFPKMDMMAGFNPPLKPREDLITPKEPAKQKAMRVAMREDASIEYNYIEGFDSEKVIPRSEKSLLFEGCHGFGDNFYQRPIIKDVAKHFKVIYLATAFPEAYWDIPNVKFVYPRRVLLRTQKKHMDSLPKETWSARPPKNIHLVPWGAIGPPADAKIQTRYVELENKEDFDFSFPLKTAWIEAARKVIAKLPLKGKKLCIIRRTTNRTEWNCPSRNPKPEYYQLLIDNYKHEYFFLGLADIKPKEEWFDADLNGIDKEFNKGEIPLTTILALMKLADMTITYPSFFMIAAIALRATCFTIWGGASDPMYSLRKRLGLQNFGYVAPEPTCSCHRMEHDCKKDIPIKRIISKFEELRRREKYIKSVTVGVPPGLCDSYWVMAHMESFKERQAIDELNVAVMEGLNHNYTANILRSFSFVNEVRCQEKQFILSELYETDPPQFMLKDTQGVDYFIDFGALMWKKGINLEDIYPECKTNLNCWEKMTFPKETLRYATNMKRKNKGKLVLFYPSANGNNTNWNGGAWNMEDWLSLAERIFDYSGIRPILIGARYDKDSAIEIKSMDERKVVQSLVGQTSMAQVLSLVKEAKLVMGFASGIPIMATYMGVPTVIFWSVNGISRLGRFDKEFMHTWRPADKREDGSYVPVIYDSPWANPAWIFNRIKRYL